ncbi:matrix extracellular phosphoglycoprotein [Sphaerodactylus townsendi]|uniref:matrix extracellular phosphoglycoprotein n=1 Tax=Sphaerodactylus townsendi TaxID=933632 RepID=UPI002027684E|nr:matrix extracellular phosphoglycoprotein [Sphaerodactylus townsendi]
MKVPLLYLSLFGLVWAQSELQPHYKKDKEKCMGGHQITVRSRNARHKYYIFHYIYSSLMPNNQTWIKKEEDNDKHISSGQQGPDKETGPRKPMVDHTIEEKEEGHINLTEMGNNRESEDNTWNLNEYNENTSSRKDSQHHSNPKNRAIPLYHLEFIADKGRNDTSTDDTADDIDGSGVMGFIDQDERHHGAISGNEHQYQQKDHQGTRNTKTNSLWERNETGQSGMSNNTKLSRATFIKIGVKENDASVIQEINPHKNTPKKSEGSKSYLDVSTKVKSATGKEPGKEVGYGDMLDKDKGENASSRLQTHFNVQGKISEDLFGKLDRRRNGGNYTSSPDTDAIKMVNENIVNFTSVCEKGGNEYAMLNGKLDGKKDIYKETKPYQKGEVRDNIMSSKQIELADVMKLRKKLAVKDDIISGMSSSHIDVAGISKTHRIGGGEDLTGKSITQMENPSFILAGKINQSRIITSGRLNGSGDTKSHTKGRDEVTLFGGVSVSQGSGSYATNQSRKGSSEVGIIHEISNKGLESFHLINTHRKKADSHEKINRKAHRGKQGDPEMQGKGDHKPDVTFQEGNKEVVQGNTGYRKAHGTAGLSTDSSIRKEENSKRKSIRIKSALSLAHGSHNYKHIAKSKEHLSLKNARKLTEPSKKSSRVHHGRRNSNIAKQYHGHLGVLQQESRSHDKKSKSRKSVHASDRSHSSESEENSRTDSRQSYEDYQNDNPDSDQSAESAQQDLSAGSNQSDNQSQMEDICCQKDYQGHRSN